MIEAHYARWLNPLLANINAGPLRKFGTEDNEGGKGEEKLPKKAAKNTTTKVRKGKTAKTVKKRVKAVA